MKTHSIAASSRFLGRFWVLVAALAVLPSTPHAQDSKTVPQGPIPNPVLDPQVADRPLTSSPRLPESLKGRVLTLDNIVSIALATNRDLALQTEAYLRTRGSTTSARAGLGPTLNLNYNLYGYNVAQTSNLGGQSIVTNQQFQNQVNAIVSVPIDISGELRAARDQAKFNEIVAKLEINRTRNEIVLQAKTAFYSVLRAQALVKVAQDALQNAVDRLSDAQLRVSAGTSARFDVTTAKSDVATAERTLIGNRSSLSQAFASLNSVIGIDVDTPVMLTSAGAVEIPESAKSAYVGPDIKPSKAPENDIKVGADGTVSDLGAAQAAAAHDVALSNPLPENAEYRSLLNDSIKTRPEILRDDAAIAAAKKGVTVAHAGLKPSLSLGYNYAYTPNTGAFGQQTTGYGQLTLSVPIFDSGAARGRVTQANAGVATAETNRRGTIDSITLELRKAYLNLQAAELSVKVARQSLAQADEAYRLARLRYTTGVTSQEGISPIVELSNAQQTLSQAQSDYVNALYDYNNGRCTVDKAVGRYAYTQNNSGHSAPPPTKEVGRQSRRTSGSLI